MYAVLKKLLFHLVPEKLLKRIEFILRYFYSLLYLGSSVRCNVCGARFSGFISLESGDLLCPRCGSLPRQRRLWIILQPHLSHGDRIKMLHFSPSRILQKRLRRMKNLQYVTSDYDRNAGTEVHYDITRIPEPDDSFGLIVCFHILEHIRDDRMAISELYRVVKPEGRIFIQTPFKEGEIYEDATLTTAAERLHHFGQEDHVRVYSADGLTSRLKEAGFTVQAEPFRDDPILGLKEEIVLICSKTKSHIVS
jgi:hypothetical protein